MAGVVGVLALVTFVLWELRSKRPMLDPRHFVVRPFAAGTLSITVGHAAIFGLFFVALQYLQQIPGYAPLVSGLAVLCAHAPDPGGSHRLHVPLTCGLMGMPPTLNGDGGYGQSAAGCGIV